MIEKKIKFTDVSELKDFVRAAGLCDFDINAFYCSTCIDAKSLLGMMYLGSSKELTIRYGFRNAAFEHVVEKYAVA